MGKRGPRPEPTILKIAKGNPGKRRLNKDEPKPASDGIQPPEWVTGNALAKWNEIVPQLLAMGVMTNADVEPIARYCTMHEQYVKYLDQVRRGLDVLVIRDNKGKVKYMQSTPAAVMLTKLAASMLRIEQEFGLTPSARTGIVATKQRHRTPTQRRYCSADKPCGECASCRAVLFFETFFTHAKGELGGKLFHLERWQVDFLRALFAEKRKQRQIRTSLLAIPRKNGKSSLAAGIALKLLMEDEPGCEVYSCAASRDQARLVFDMARIAVEQSPVLSKHLKVYRNAIVREKTHATYKALSAEAGIQHGLSAHGVIFDELHVSNREMWEVMLSSQGARRQPLTVALTTAGYDRKSVCWEIWKYAEAVRDGSIKDPTFLPAIYAADPEADWKDERTWAKANPNLGVSVKTDFLRSECARAVEMPSYENTFRTLYLNQWVSQEERWLRMDHWMQGDQACPVDLRGRECFGGLDLATTFDTTCLALAFPLEDGTTWIEPHFWIPEENMQQRVKRDKVQYDVWARQGHLHLTHGNVTDYDQVRADINDLAAKYNIRQIAIDRWNATQLATQLQGDGLELVGFGQGYGSMSAASKMLEQKVVGGTLLHHNPVLDWQAGNVAIQQDHAGNIKPSKAKSTERIDGIVATVMAIGIMATATAAPEMNWDIIEI